MYPIGGDFDLDIGVGVLFHLEADGHALCLGRVGRITGASRLQ